MRISKVASPFRFPSVDNIWLASLVALPYIMYGAVPVIFSLMVSAMLVRGRSVWQLCGRWGFGWLSAGLLLSACFGINRGDAFLQLVHFLPFFVLWGICATHPKAVAQPFQTLETVARWLVLSAMPICAIALVEYLLKIESWIASIKASPLPNWLINWLYYHAPYYGHRSRSLFDHPNGLSSYLVIVLGLGLGLLLKDLTASATLSPSRRQVGWSVGSVVLCLGAIFCTGSRNGVLISLVLVLACLYSARRYRWALLSGAAGIGAIAAAVLSFGIGGRSLSLAIFTNDPRVGVWRLAIDMIWERPWFGWGLSGFREHYVPGSVQSYEIIFHAHNIWLFLASETGIPVTLGLCAVIGTLVYRAVCTYLGKGAVKGLGNGQHNNLSPGDKAVLLSYLLAFAACLMFALFDVVLFDARLNIVSWGLLAALHLLSGSPSHSADKSALQQGE